MGLDLQETQVLLGALMLSCPSLQTTPTVIQDGNASLVLFFSGSVGCSMMGLQEALWFNLRDFWLRMIRHVPFIGLQMLAKPLGDWLMRSGRNGF